MCSLCRGNVSYVSKEMEISFTGDYCLLRYPKALFIGLLIKPNMIFFAIEEISEQNQLLRRFVFYYFYDLYFPSQRPPVLLLECHAEGLGVEW